MNEPWPEEGAWTERLLLIASGEAARTPEVEAALRDDPRVAALWRDLQVLEAGAPGPEAPRLAIARAREAFEAEARPGLWERLRAAVLVPVVAGAVALALGLVPTPAAGPSWDGAHLEARLAQAQQALGSLEAELAADPVAELPGQPFAWEPRELAWLVEAEDPAEALGARPGAGGDAGDWDDETWDAPDHWESLETDLRQIEQALERL